MKITNIGSMLKVIPKKKTGSYGWAVTFADWVLKNSMEVTFQEALIEKSHREPSKWDWFKENKGICPTCRTDLNELLDKVDLTPHFSGTCKQ